MSSINLKYLDDDKISQEVCSLYWALDEAGECVNKVSDIAEVFDTTTSKITQIAKLCCIAYAATSHCCDCGEPYIYTSRADYKAHINYVWKCSVCNQEELRRMDEEKKSRVSFSLDEASEYCFSLNSLNFKQAIYLLSVIRHLASEELEYLESYNSNQASLLSPDEEYDIEILRYLKSKNIIAISPLSDPASIVVEDESSYSYYIKSVKWEVLVDSDIHSSINMFIQELEEKLSSMEWDDSWYDEAKELCKEVALQESLAYLQYVMADHQFEFTPGDKTKLVINKVLEKYSVSQFYCLAWGASKDAAAYFMRSGIPKRQAANSVVGGIERKYERAKTNGWETKAFSRNYELPMSVLSQVLFNTALQTDDGGFHKSIDEII